MVADGKVPRNRTIRGRRHEAATLGTKRDSHGKFPTSLPHGTRGCGKGRMLVAEATLHRRNEGIEGIVGKSIKKVNSEMSGKCNRPLTHLATGV
jgi:hypothetical protein